MTILATDVTFYKSAVVSSDSTNGGRISENEAVSGQPNAIWPNVTKAQRDSGDTIIRKIFAKIMTNSADTLIDPQLWNEYPTPGDDHIIMYPGTTDDTVATMVTTDSYCSAVLKNNYAAGATAVVLVVEDTTMSPAFADTKTLRFTDKSTPTSTTGNEEQKDIDGTPSVSGTDITITLSAALENSFLAGDKVQVVYNTPDLQAIGDNFVFTSSAGTYDDSTYPLIGNNSGAVTETITCTFADNLTFTAVGSVSGTLTSGSADTDWTPAHPINGNDMFTLPFAGFGGTRVNGDTLVFEVVAAVLPFWLKMIVPAGAGALANDSNMNYLYGQSA